MKIIVFLIFYSIYGVTQTLSDKNFSGQKYLFEKGWYVIPSGSNAWEYFEKNSLDSSSKAMADAIRDIKESNIKKESFQSIWNKSAEFQSSISKNAKSFKEKLYLIAESIDQKGEKSSKETIEESYSKFVIGYLEFEKRTIDERKRLSQFFKNYIVDYEKNSKKFNSGFHIIRKKYLNEMQINWNKHFKNAKDDFSKYYESSGKQNNSLQGLWEITKGYFVSFYEAIVKPSGKESKYIVQKSLFYITKATFNTFIFLGSTVYSTGLNLYAASSYGYKIISPTIESGFLAGVALITYSASKVSKYTLKTTGTISKVAIDGTGKILSTGKFVLDTSANEAKSAAYEFGRFSSGAGEVALEVTQGAVVLGYTALTQLSAQTLLGAINSTIFLVYDGPQIIIAKVKGDQFKNLPPGTVLDKESIEREGFEIEELDVDDKTKKKILEKIQ